MTGPGPRVAYTDPMWAVDERGEVDPARADLEAVDGDLRLDLGLRRDGRFVIDGPDFLDWVRGADAVVIYRAQVTPEMVEVIRPTCRVVARQGVGTDNLNAPLLAEAGIYAFNVPDYCVDEVTTHTMALLLALERQVPLQDAAVKAGRWDIFGGGYPRRLCELTLGIVGVGRIGRATARKAGLFYGNLLGYDPNVHPDLMAGYGITAVPTLAELMSRSDAVVVHASLDQGNRHLVGVEAVRAMRPGAMLVNTARGGLVDPEAVLEGLSSGRLGGYGSDVFTPEDPLAHPVNRQIVTFPNVVVSSHRAFLSAQSERRQRTRVMEEIRRVLRDGEPPLFGRMA